MCAEREPCCREAGYCFDREEKKKIQSNLCSCTRPNIKATHTKAKAPLSVVTADWRVNRPDLYVQICWEQQCGCLGWCHLPLGCPLHFKHNVSLSFIEETSKPVWRTERERVQKKEKVIREKVCVCLCHTLGSLPGTAGRRLHASLRLYSQWGSRERVAFIRQLIAPRPPALHLFPFSPFTHCRTHQKKTFLTRHHVPEGGGGVTFLV